MIEPDKRRAVFLLHEHGMGVRPIARRLGINRGTVRDIIAQRGALPPAERPDPLPIDPELLRRLDQECDGWKQRIHEKLAEEHGIQVAYSTLTRKLRALGIGRARQVRCDRVPDQPGAEMQHDTTVYTILLEEKPCQLVASSLYLRYSKRRYLRFYRSFNRFAMKGFFHDVLTFWGCAAAVCIIDNTNLARLRGTGKNAVLVPEMAAFAASYGFQFQCHAAGHANRKAGEERSFFTVETNFLPGRTFRDLADLNAQALEWATVRMYHRAVAKTRLIPAKAFEHERAHLRAVPPELPAPYLVHERETDQYGYVALGGNYFWVPGDARDCLRVLEYPDRVKLYRDREFLVEYPLPADGVKNASFSPAGQPKPRHGPQRQRRPTAEEEQRLRSLGDVVGGYLDFALEPKGIERHGFVRKLFALSQQMTPEHFRQTLARAHRYRIVDLEVLRRIAWLCLNQDVERLPQVDVDENYREREAYRQGRLTDAPNFSAYDALLEDEHGPEAGGDRQAAAPARIGDALGRVPGGGAEGAVFAGPTAPARPGGGGEAEAGHGAPAAPPAGPPSGVVGDGDVSLRAATEAGPEEDSVDL
jgi:transposase